MTLSSETLLILTSSGLSLAFNYIPNLKKRWDTFDETQKRSLMALMLAVISALLVLLSCTSVTFSMLPKSSCDQVGVERMVEYFVVALAINQGVHFGTKPAKAVTDADA